MTEHWHLKKCDAPDLHPQKSIQYLESDLQNIRIDIDDANRILAAKADLAKLQAEIAKLAVLGHTHPVAEINQLSALLNAKANVSQIPIIPGAATAGTAGLLTPEWLAKILALRAMANVDAPPANGKPYAFQNGAWVEIVGGGWNAQAILTATQNWTAPKTQSIRVTLIGGGGGGGNPNGTTRTRPSCPRTP